MMSLTIILSLLVVFLALQEHTNDAFSVAPKTTTRMTRQRPRFTGFTQCSSASTDESSITPTPSSSSSLHDVVNGLNATAVSSVSSKTSSNSTSSPPSSPHSIVPLLHNKPVDAALLTLPRHSNVAVNEILTKAQATLEALHKHSQAMSNDMRLVTMQDDNTGPAHERVFANSYVDLGKVETIGFDYDYTLVTYTEELLELIYDMALKRLVHDRQYPLEMLHSNLKFNPRFSIRGKNKSAGWVCAWRDEG